MNDVLGYQGQNVVITGAASGMGQAAAQLLVDLGAQVYALDLTQNPNKCPARQFIEQVIPCVGLTQFVFRPRPHQVDQNLKRWII